MATISSWSTGTLVVGITEGGGCRLTVLISTIDVGNFDVSVREIERGMISAGFYNVNCVFSYRAVPPDEMLRGVWTCLWKRLAHALLVIC